MSKFLLEIKLLSDMCVSDGGVYNSSVDVDICYDKYGFPYIPAKRIRGCLRECAVELQDWNLDIPWKKMFGQAGDSKHRAAVRISDAHLAGYEEMKELVRKNGDKTVFHPQNVLSHFTYIRTQTSIDPETGVADAASLRTMRVADKDLTFIAEVDMDPVYREELKKCCAVFRHIGISRTRGLGEIEVSLKSAMDSMSAMETESETRHADYKEGSEILRYELYLEEPVICKSVNGGEARTLDYIEGSKMLGLVIENADAKEKFIHFMNSAELFCSNAYISQDGIRYTEVPAYIYSVKNDSSHYVNKLYPDPVILEEEKPQLNRMKHCYVYIDEKQRLQKKSVEIEERYHHRRPEDKSVGRAAEEKSGNSQFYQMSAMEAGQNFQGYFSGSAEQVKEIYDILAKREIYYVGYSRTSEYGKVRLRITGTEERPEPEVKKVKTFCVKLEAPAIVYNNNAFYSVDTQDLIAEINEVLGISEDMLDEQAGIRRYVRYTMLGGFHTTWNYRKPTITAFDKGTALLYTLREETEITIPSVFLIGERVSEGFGEVSVQIMDPEMECDLLEIKEEASELWKGKVDAGESAFSYALCQDLFQDDVSLAAARSARKSKYGFETRPTVSNMLLMCQENPTFAGVKSACHNRYSKSTDQKKKKIQLCRKYSETDRDSSRSSGRFLPQIRDRKF